ncbi:MAG: DUF1330 domain-containing protein [Proteobacteria bacterium]|nr:DUF1330 domain-containing protein [Pseudomonadota bacterium]
MSILPRADQFQTMMEKGPADGMVMVNLLKFRAKANYGADKPEAKENLTGRQAYRRYGAVAMKQVAAVGGRPVWGGAQNFVMIGDNAPNDWDEVVCVYYPSKDAFLTMTQNPDYQAGHYHREAGLERTVILCCQPEMKP